MTDCNFTNNKASNDGGAIRFSGECAAGNCNFTNNKASNDGGAVYFLDEGTVGNCNFTGNNAHTGSAICFRKELATKTVSNSIFLNNRADAEALEITKNDDNITIIFTGKDNLLNAIYSQGDVTFTDVTYWSANGITNTGSSAVKPSRSNREAGQNITVGIIVNGELVLSEVKVTDENGEITLDMTVGENYYIGARHYTDSYYTEATKILSNQISEENSYEGDEDYNTDPSPTDEDAKKVSTKAYPDEDVSGKAGEKTDIRVKFVDENGNPVKNGTATLTVDGKTYTAEVIDGDATFRDVVIPENDAVADVHYPGNDYYNASSTTLSIKVKQDNNNTEPDSNKTAENNNTAENKTAKHIPSQIGEGNATGNPIAMMLLALFALVITYRKK